MNTLIILAISLLAIKGNGQILAIWKGNCPGHERKWDHPANWSTNAVPDEFSDVVIPLDNSADTHYPVISNNTAQVNSLHIWPGAVLRIDNGKLEILDIEKCVFRRHQVIGSGTAIALQKNEAAYLATNKPDQNHDKQ